MRSALTFVCLVCVLLFAACSSNDSTEELIIYSGRSKTLVEPLIERFEQESGIRVRVRYGDTAQLVAAISEEGHRSPADVFWAQDAGALGTLDVADMLAMLPDSLLALVPENYEGQGGTWVATSGRARSLVYSTTRVDAANLPASVFELAGSQYAGRIGWAPTNASFQAFITAMRKMAGEERTREWLIAMRNNGTRGYGRNTAIVQAVADGEIDFGLTNHYYLLQFKQDDPNFPAVQTYFSAGDPGNLVNVAGIGVLGSSRHADAAHRFISFLLSQSAQQYFITETFEYPVNEERGGQESLILPAGLREARPSFDLDALRDLPATLDLLRQVGLL
jgi:iron(III) transport system substrate-binding protein